MGRILVIEDSESTRSAYQEALGRRYEVIFAGSVHEGLSLGAKENYDLFLIDLTLPDGDGFELCRSLQKELGSQMPPFLFVSGRYDLQDKLTGFAMGAEDYIVKPFDLQELKARVDIRLRRNSKADLVEIARRFGLSIDSHGLRAFVRENGQERDLNLTPNEFRLLCALITHSGQVLTRAELLQAGWGSGVHVLERTVDRHISGLRRKLGAATMYLEAVPGQGYCWSKAPSKAG